MLNYLFSDCVLAVQVVSSAAEPAPQTLQTRGSSAATRGASQQLPRPHALRQEVGRAARR